MTRKLLLCENEKLCWIVFYIKMYFFKFPSTTVVLLNIRVYIVCSIVCTMKFYYAVSYVCIIFSFLYFIHYSLIGMCKYYSTECVWHVRTVDSCNLGACRFVCVCVSEHERESISVVMYLSDISDGAGVLSFCCRSVGTSEWWHFMAWRSIKWTFSISCWTFVDISRMIEYALTNVIDGNTSPWPIGINEWNCAEWKERIKTKRFIFPSNAGNLFHLTASRVLLGNLTQTFRIEPRSKAQMNECARVWIKRFLFVDWIQNDFNHRLWMAL